MILLSRQESRFEPLRFGAHRSALRWSLVAKNGKGCDFGYALAASSCEGVLGVEACTVTALERSPLSQFQTPADISQRSRFFRVWRLFRSPGLEPIPRHTSERRFWLRPFLPSMEESD